ncbi:hypothetical protein [Paenibacillus sp. 481]|uniref:hypothetical protein n=1 Tax=Paenibacillus sp. 481 TaxID=2835869 RepID=UPI001E31DA54|nr:hypothetical protein [Paenibacillus sp. 481]UHA74447.1 hypothetical protein KIK04_04890 [Paenibacillus sp. 481]
MIKVERIVFVKDFPVDGEAYAILAGGNGFAFAWGSEYPFADEIPAKNVEDGADGFEWHETEQAARFALKAVLDSRELAEGK